MRSAISVCLVIALTVAVQDSRSAVTVKGFPSCGQWVEARGKNVAGKYESWLMGYLSGIALAKDFDVLDGRDAASLHLWMDKFCQRQPLESVADGGLELFFELHKKAGTK